MGRKGKLIGLLLILCTLLFVPGIAKTENTIYLIAVRGTIDPGLASFVERGYEEAEAAGADRVILDIDTYGGRIDAAIRIKERILSSTVPSTSFISSKAISAGALIALAGEKVYMAPGTTIGAAEPRLGTEKADEKVVSMWSQALASTAETHGKDGNIAAAMADADIEISGLVVKGKLLTLTQQQALEVGIADDAATSIDEVVTKSDLGGAGIVKVEIKPVELVARWVTNPYVSPLLLTIGIAGIILEVFTVGWGIAGTLGIIAFALFFGGSIIAGLSGWIPVLIFVVGIILMVVEIFVPGFGVAGVGGIILLAVSIVLASVSVEQAVISLIIALVGTVVLLALSFKFLKTRNLWKRLILGIKQNRSEGYNAPPIDNLANFMGAEGRTMTPLRPAGTIDIGGIRVDVVTEGGFIPHNVPVRVIGVEGTRVIVRQIENS